MNYNLGLQSFYNEKKVFITGHTGFKGAWLTSTLLKLGAVVGGYSIDSGNKESLFNKTQLSCKIIDFRGDIRDFNYLKKCIDDFSPEIVFHLAAQPLVSVSYLIPLETIEVNLLGTVNLLEILRHNNTVKSIIIITTDKVYMPLVESLSYKEEDRLGGIDPYSSSKAAVEILVESYYSSFFKNLDKAIGVATARAGNVIGGGDWAENRIIPDFFRALKFRKPLTVRNPKSIRPWQHVMDPIIGYLTLGNELYYNPDKYSGPWNFGPSNSNVVDVLELIRKFKGVGLMSEIVFQEDSNFEETKVLLLDSEKAKNLLYFEAKIELEKLVELTSEFYLNYDSCDLSNLMDEQINFVLNLHYRNY